MKKTFLPNTLIVGVDFDGTITNEPEIGKKMTLKYGCREALNSLKKDHRIRLVLWTCRTGEALEDAKKFLYDNWILQYFDEINDQLPEVKRKYEPNVARKLGADVYVDDKNVGSVISWDWVRFSIESELELLKGETIYE